MSLDDAIDRGERRELVCFRIGGQEFCVDIMGVREIRGWTPATPLPGAPGFVRGLINLRGAVLPVLDLAARLGLGQAQPTARHVIIVVQVGSRVTGLLVDAVSDILTVSDEQLQPTPSLAAPEGASFVQGILTIDQRMISLIALNRVTPEQEQQAA
jgi:purine-binding chemotaxis protein CheW